MNHAKCQQEWHNNESEHTATTLCASAWIICSLGDTSYKGLFTMILIFDICIRNEI